MVERIVTAKTRIKKDKKKGQEDETKVSEEEGKQEGSTTCAIHSPVTTYVGNMTVGSQYTEKRSEAGAESPLLDRNSISAVRNRHPPSLHLATMIVARLSRWISAGCTAAHDNLMPNRLVIVVRVTNRSNRKNLQQIYLYECIGSSKYSGRLYLL